MIFGTELDRRKEQITPGIRYIDLASASDFVFGISLIVEIIIMSIDEYAMNPYTPNSMIDMSPNILLRMYRVNKNNGFIRIKTSST